MARHRRPVNVRDDGLPAVLGPLITAGGVELAVLVDVDSGMVLDAWAQGGEAETSDAEALGARHADVVRALFALAGAPPAELGLTVRTSEDHEQTRVCIRWLTCGNAEGVGRGRVTTGVWS